MRRLLWLVAAAAVLWAGYWFIAARSLDAGLRAALDDLAARGGGAYSDLSVGGFPSRFDVTLSAPEFRSAGGLVTWQGAELRSHALSYKPHHIIVRLPETQQLSIGPETLQIVGPEMNLSAVFGLSPSLPLDHAQLVGAPLAIAAATGGWTLQARELRLAIRAEGSAATPRIGAELFDVELRDVKGLQNGPETLTSPHMRLDSVLTLSAPLDRTIAQTPRRIEAIDLRALDLELAGATLQGAGQISVRADGAPEGQIQLGIENWQPLLQAAADAGLVRKKAARNWEKILTQVAKLSGDRNRLGLPLVFRDGKMSLGPIPLGPAPRLFAYRQ